MKPDAAKNTNVIQNTLWILGLNFKHVPVIATARIIGYINSNANSLIRAFILGLVIDRVIAFINGPQDQGLIISSLLVFAGYYLYSGLASVATNYGNNLISFKMGYELPATLLHEKLNRLGSATLEEPEIQNLINRYRENTYTFNDLARYLFTLIGVGTSLVIAIIPLFYLLPAVTILLVLVSIPAFIINRHVINLLLQLDKKSTILNRRGSQLVNMLNDPARLKEIKLLNAHKYLRGYFEEYINKYFGEKVTIYNRWAFYDFVNTILTGAVILLGIYGLIQLAANGTITVGQIAFYLSALTGVGNYIDNFSANFASYIGTSQRMSEMRKLLNWPEPEVEGKKVLERFDTPPLLKLENVNFKYPNSEKLVIKDLNLEIKPGEKVAIVGENGAGKTTLVKLISNVYPVTSGQVLVNGDDLNSIETHSWFNNLGILYQDYNTYDDLSAFENIALGRIDQELNYEEIQEAAKKADAYDFIMDYQENFSQILSERYEGGTRPSTGQWQKIAIARFFYRNAPVLILDEPTASIDAVAEANIFNRIYQFIENKTVIIISHRFATVRNADRIIVFDQGQIIEEGSHEKLMELDGKYAHAFKLQAKGYN